MAVRQQEPAITFTAAVPAAPAQAQVYRLAPTSVPTAFINEKLTAVKLPALKLEEKTLVSRGKTGQTPKDQVRAFADPVSGDVHFVPNLLELATAANQARQLTPETAVSVARTALTDIRFIPKDVTELRVSDAIPVMGGSAAHSAATGAVAPKTVMHIVPALRYAGGMRVYGRGSHALVSVANDQSITGALRRWRTASLGNKIKPEKNAAQVKADIVRQLTPYAKNGVRATVDQIELAYYDGNANYLQPVYRFAATLTPAQKGAANTRIAGYVPIGAALEPIPDLATAPSGEKPSMSSSPAAASARPEMKTEMAGGVGGVSSISVGEFANADWPNSGAYLDMANNFLNGLNFGHIFAPGEPPFVRTIWWTAYSWQVNSPSSKQWMNAVNVAYTEPHGDWWLNTALRNDADFWYINKIGTGGNPGFGAAAGGKLATWVIMSCEVVPSVYDLQNQIGGNGNGGAAFTPWWPVFQGLHNVIGFRTEMLYPDDALQFGFGEDAAFGGDINAAWFHEVAAVDGNDGTYQSQHLKGNPQVHWDRASTIIDARDLGQSIYSVGAQTASSTLWNFWMGN
ncbi:MAG: hypothetical protein ABSC47_04300 [Terracidiphilus sp.]|jgi:hypothetical protein